MDIKPSLSSAGTVAPADAASVESVSFQEQIRKIMQGSDASAAVELQRAVAGPNGAGTRLSELPQDQAYELLSARRSTVQNVAQDAIASGQELSPEIQDVLEAMGIGISVAPTQAAVNDGYDPGLSQADVQDLKNTLSSKDS